MHRANFVSRKGVAAPTTSDTKEPAMARSLFTPADGATITPVVTLFIEALDGLTFASLEELDSYNRMDDDADDYDADAAYERHLETNEQYRWEHEQDEARAAAFGFAFDAWQDRVWSAA
jgi:hypothetical protein